MESSCEFSNGDLVSTITNITKAAEILQKGQFRIAKDIYLQILDKVKNVKNSSVKIIKQLCNHHLGSIELYNKQYKKARNYFEEALTYIDSEGDKSFLQKLLGETLLGLGEYNKAIEIFELLLANKNVKDKLNTQIWLAKALYNSDNGTGNNSQRALGILEDEVLKQDPNNIEALTYISDLAIKRGLGKYCTQHMLVAIAYSSLKKDTNQDTVRLVKTNFANLMKSEENLSAFEKLTGDMSVYRHMGQVLKEFGAAESSLKVFNRALSLDNVKNNRKELVSVIANLIGVLEVFNNYQESFNVLKNFYKTYPDIKVGGLKNEEIYKIIEYVNDIFSDEYKYANGESYIKLRNNKENDLLDLNLNPYDEVELELIALHFTLVKILFVSGCLYVIPLLIQILEPHRIGREFHKTIIRNQNSYYLYIAQLMSFITYPLPKTDDIIYICGDSHSLALSWHTIDNKLIVPKLVTGLKCWHMQPQTLFFTKKNFDNVVDSIPDKSTIIFVFGEIDCREGITGAYEKCRYNTLEEGIEFTANIYLKTLKELEKIKSIKALIHPVPPVLDVTRKIVILFNDYLKSQTVIQYMDFGDNLLSEDKKEFNKEFELDSTHMAPIYKKLVDKFII